MIFKIEETETPVHWCPGSCSYPLRPSDCSFPASQLCAASSEQGPATPLLLGEIHRDILEGYWFLKDEAYSSSTDNHLHKGPRRKVRLGALEEGRRVQRKCAVQASGWSKSSLDGKPFLSHLLCYFLPNTSPPAHNSPKLKLSNYWISPYQCHLMVTAELSFPPHSYCYPDNLNTHENKLPNTLTSHFLISLSLFFWAALGLCCCRQAFSSCSERGLLFVAVCGLLIAVASRCRAWALGVQASVVVARRL